MLCNCLAGGASISLTQILLARDHRLEQWRASTTPTGACNERAKKAVVHGARVSMPKTSVLGISLLLQGHPYQPNC